MKSSKYVETCFVRANNDFDDKLTGFSMKNNFWTKIPKNGHCVTKQNNIKTRKNEKISLATVSVLEFVYLIIAFVFMYSVFLSDRKKHFFQKLNLPKIKWFLSVLLLNEFFNRDLPQSRVNGRSVPRWFDLPLFSDSDLTRRLRLKTVLYCPITLILVFPLFFPPTTDRLFNTYHHFQFLVENSHSRSEAKLYIPSTLNIDLILWHT